MSDSAAGDAPADEVKLHGKPDKTLRFSLCSDNLEGISEGTHKHTHTHTHTHTSHTIHTYSLTHILTHTHTHTHTHTSHTPHTLLRKYFKLDDPQRKTKAL